MCIFVHEGITRPKFYFITRTLTSTYMVDLNYALFTSLPLSRCKKGRVKEQNQRLNYRNERRERPLLPPRGHRNVNENVASEIRICKRKPESDGVSESDLTPRGRSRWWASPDGPEFFAPSDNGWNREVERRRDKDWRL